MRVMFKYADVALDFPSKEAFKNWCEFHLNVYSGFTLSRNGRRADEVFQVLISSKDPGNVLPSYAPLPPIREEAIGQFLFGLKEVAQQEFAVLLGGWDDFGRNGVSDRRDISAHQAMQVSLLTLGKLGVFDSERARVQRLIDDQQKSIAELENTKKTFDEFMGLKAPADYWEKKSSRHHDSAKLYLGFLLKASFAFVAISVFLPIVFVVNGLDWVALHSGSAGFETRVVLIPLLGLYLLLVTTGLWGLRVLVKLYLSEHHLRVEADEKKTMAMTYLAITERSEVTAEDRAIVLSSLFRPAQDGVVREDGVDHSLPQLLARLLAK